jgi:deoxyribodipyrimidine photolyase-related protein
MSKANKKIGLLFPHQLVYNPEIFAQCDEWYLIEDSLFFGDPYTQLSFHINKRIFHRASMKAFYDELVEHGITCSYLDYQDDTTIVTDNRLDDNQEYVVQDPTDFLLEKRLQRRFPNITFLSSPLFINSREDNEQFMDGRDSYFMHHFYQWQRKRLGILIDDNGQPEGGSWSYDSENRKKIPKHHIPELPEDPKEYDNDYVREAKEYVAKVFPESYGHDAFKYIYPVTRTDAKQWFDDFLKHRFVHFGPYEDAIVQDHTILYHSLLSPLLNVGLLHPTEVVDMACSYAQEHDVPLNSLEGFVRQIIGWREFIRLVYEREGTTMRTSNMWNHKRPLPKGFWSAETGLEPVDECIKRLLATGYTHHIERLMLFGNLMFLQETDPDDVYTWFMEMFIDSYDWVMVPNVYGMTQNTAHGLMTTKPYISGSNYLKKMSNISNGPWADTWDALYWSFIIKHRKELEENGRMFFVTNRAKKFDQETINAYEETKQVYYRSQN